MKCPQCRISQKQMLKGSRQQFCSVMAMLLSTLLLSKLLPDIFKVSDALIELIKSQQNNTTQNGCL